MYFVATRAIPNAPSGASVIATLALTAPNGARISGETVATGELSEPSCSSACSVGDATATGQEATDPPDGRVAGRLC